MQIGLNFLRQHISLIPQHPFFFRGTIRQNLDPSRQTSEESLWEVLESAGLGTYIRGLPDKLESEMSKYSELFSVGQKQLLSLSRALLSNNRFLILDEATSSLDT